MWPASTTNAHSLGANRVHAANINFEIGLNRNMDHETADLYQAVILDHDARPRNFGAPESAIHTSTCYNPLCGDAYRLFLSMNEDRIEAVHFDGNGCAVSKASLSMMTSALTGKTAADAIRLYQALRDALLSDAAASDALPDELMALTTVRNAPTRVTCALLGWEALYRALRPDDAHR